MKKVNLIIPGAGVIIQQLFAKVDYTIADSSSALDGKTPSVHKVLGTSVDMSEDQMTSRPGKPRSKGGMGSRQTNQVSSQSMQGPLGSKGSRRSS